MKKKERWIYRPMFLLIESLDNYCIFFGDLLGGMFPLVLVALGFFVCLVFVFFFVCGLFFFF